MRTLIVTVLVAGGLILGGDLVVPGTCPVLALGVDDPPRQGVVSSQALEAHGPGEPSIR
jgi:hypothetical protein